jgi:hypothetical protein
MRHEAHTVAHTRTKRESKEHTLNLMQRTHSAQNPKAPKQASCKLQASTPTALLLVLMERKRAEDAAPDKGLERRHDRMWGMHCGGRLELEDHGHANG